MQNITVKRGQSLFDLAIEVYGSAEGAFDLALENNLSITDELTPGQILIYNPENVTNKAVVDYYRTNNIVPATAANFGTTACIGDAMIESNFIIE